MLPAYGLLTAHPCGGEPLVRTYRQTPRSCLTLPATWPHGRATNVSTEYAQRFVQNLLTVLGPRSYRYLARESGVSHGTISAVVRGDSWPDFQTVTRIEHALCADLWPGPDVLLAELRRLRAQSLVNTTARRARLNPDTEA